MSPISPPTSDNPDDDHPPWLPSTRPFFGKRRKGRRELAMDLIQAGLRILERDGPRLSGDQLTLAAAINELNLSRDDDKKVSPGSVYDRLWATPDDYRVDVQSAALYEWFSSSTTPQQDQIAAEVLALLDELDLETPKGRAMGLREITRRASFTSLEATAAYRPAQVRVAILAALAASTTDDEATEQLKRAARAAHNDTIASYVELYGGVLDLLKLRPKESIFGPTDTPELRLAAVEIFTRIIITYNDGMDIRNQVEVEGTHLENLPSGVDGELKDWHHLGLGVWAIASALSEPDTGAETEDR